MRVVLVSQVPGAAHGLTQALRALGHEPVALLCTRDHRGRYGDQFGALVEHAPAGLDVLVPAARDRIAPLLRPLELDLLLCAAFPWRIPGDALEVPRLGAVNGHPSLLPRYRGPNPMAWAIRNGDGEIGFTFHRMEREFDTGPVLGQAAFPLDDARSWEELQPKFAPVIGELLPLVLERVARGDPGDVQREEDASDAPYFEPEYAEIDWSSSAAEIQRQVHAWRFASLGPGEHGPLAILDGERVRVLWASLEPGTGRPVACGDGTIWVVETEPV